MFCAVTFSHMVEIYFSPTNCEIMNNALCPIYVRLPNDKKALVSCCTFVLTYVMSEKEIRVLRNKIKE